MVEIMEDTPEINRIADLITDDMEGCIRHHLATGADAIQFGDDFGTQRGCSFVSRSGAASSSPVTNGSAP